VRDTLLIGPAELAPYGSVGTLGEQALALMRQQKASWGLLRTGYAGLASVRTRRITVGMLPFDVQFNPGRILSSSADVDPAAIRQRRCFLCHEHLPAQQHGIAFGEFLILCNPFPIFPVHLTIPHRSHNPQRIDGAFSVMLELCRRLPGMDLIYNGPRCGASAPDHLHFQAGNADFMPLLRAVGGGTAAGGATIARNELASLAGISTTLVEAAGVEVTAWDDGLRRWFQLDGEDAAAVMEAFDLVLRALGAEEEPDGEPMLNLVAFYRRHWTVLLFPRRSHRPSFYGADGGMIVSPAAVDMGGVIVTPREEDFQRMSADHIRRLFEDVLISEEGFARASGEMKRRAG
jgi:hypothetical protein